MVWLLLGTWETGAAEDPVGQAPTEGARASPAASTGLLARVLLQGGKPPALRLPCAQDPVSPTLASLTCSRGGQCGWPGRLLSIWESRKPWRWEACPSRSGKGVCVRQSFGANSSVRAFCSSRTWSWGEGSPVWASAFPSGE